MWYKSRPVLKNGVKFLRSKSMNSITQFDRQEAIESEQRGRISTRVHTNKGNKGKYFTSVFSKGPLAAVVHFSCGRDTRYGQKTVFCKVQNISIYIQVEEKEQAKFLTPFLGDIFSIQDSGQRLNVSMKLYRMLSCKNESR